MYTIGMLEFIKATHVNKIRGAMESMTATASNPYGTVSHGQLMAAAARDPFVRQINSEIKGLQGRLKPFVDDAEYEVLLSSMDPLRASMIKGVNGFGLKSIFEAFSRDTIYSVEQSTGERVFKGVMGTIELAGTVIPVGKLGGRALGALAAKFPKMQFLNLTPLEIAGKVKPGAIERQFSMLNKNVGYNISPEEWFSKYPSLGREGSFLTDYRAVGEVLGPVRANQKFSVGMFTKISKNQISYIKAWRLERALGLGRNSLRGGFRFSRISNIQNMHPRSPLFGNEYFLGPGKGLPGGGPELVVDSIATTPWP
jgi:hypothetical protein